MNKAISLHVLVKSMSKAEKRYFKLYSNLQSGDKVYLSLFRLMEHLVDIDEVCSRFGEENSGSSFEVAVKHLYAVILDCLVHLRNNQDIQARIFDSVSKAAILFERGLAEDAFAELKKARLMAEFYENDSLLLLIRRTELKYMSSMEFEGITEKRLVDKQMKLNEVLKYTRSANQHIQLYDILKYRVMHKGQARSETHRQHLNDLVLSELHLIANSSYSGFETDKLHLLFQATYFLNAGNYKTALRFYEGLITLFDENSHRMLNPPVHYLNALLGILESLRSAGLFSEMPYFISKLQQIEKGAYTAEFLLSVHAKAYIYEFSYHFNMADPQALAALRERYEETLFRKIPLLDLQVQLQLHLTSTILYLAAGELNAARHHMKKIVGAGKSLYNFPDYKLARLINLLLQAEAGNYDFFDNEITSIKRNISFSQGHYQYRTEKLVFRFVKSYPLPSGSKPRDRMWTKFQKEVDAIQKEKYERPLLKTFDYTAWIENRLTGVPFFEIITRNRSAKEY